MNDGASPPIELHRWPELLGYLEATCRDLQVYEGDRLRFTYRHGERDIAVGAYILRAVTGSRWFVVAVKVCPAKQLRPRPALVANSSLPVGSLGILRDQVVLRQSLPLDSLRNDHLEQALQALAELGLQL